MFVGGSPTINQQFSDTNQLSVQELNSVLTLSTWELQMSVTRPGYHLYFWQTGYRSQVPTTASLDLIDLLEQLTELRKTFYVLDQKHVGGRVIQGKVWGKGTEFSFPYVHQLGSCQTLPFWVFMEASSHSHTWSNHWPLVIDSTSSPSPLSGSQGCTTEGSGPQVMWLILLATSPHPYMLSKSHLACLINVHHSWWKGILSEDIGRIPHSHFGLLMLVVQQA